MDAFLFERRPLAAMASRRPLPIASRAGLSQGSQGLSLCPRPAFQFRLQRVGSLNDHFNRAASTPARPFNRPRQRPIAHIDPPALWRLRGPCPRSARWAHRASHCRGVVRCHRCKRRSMTCPTHGRRPPAPLQTGGLASPVTPARSCARRVPTGPFARRRSRVIAGGQSAALRATARPVRRCWQTHRSTARPDRPRPRRWFL